MRRFWRSVVVGVVLAGLAPLLPVGMVVADDAVVSTCDEASFDTALATAQLNSGGTITFSCSGQIDVTNTKIITSNVTILGGGDITFDGGGRTRLFIVSDVATLELDGVTLQNGSSAYGGAIFNAGTVTVTASTFSGNSAPTDGGAISNAGTVTITASTFSGNNSETYGGAIFNGGTVTITASTFSGNSAVLGTGGAISNNEGPLTVTSSTFSANSAYGHGGAIDNEGGTLTVMSSTFSGNSAISESGGAISNDDGRVTITASTFSGNSAYVHGGAIYNSYGPLTVTSSTFSGNSGRFGGAIYNLIGTLTVTASTFSGNSATNDHGGAIYNDGPLTVTSSTLSGNNSAGSGGAIANVDTLTVTSSTFSGNSATSGHGGAISNAGAVNLASSILTNSPQGGNCHNFEGSIISQGSNLSDDTSCNLIAAGDQPDTALQLGLLADNGGPTQTMLPGSPAIDAALSCATDTDQRGISRPQGTACDIGSVEVRQGATYALCASYYTGAVISPFSGGCGPGTIALDPVPQSFCVNSWTGQLTYTFGRPCTPSRITRTLAADELLLTCVSRYTGANRAVNDHSQCVAYELPNSIAATVVT